MKKALITLSVSVFVFLSAFSLAQAKSDIKRILIVPGHDDDYSGAQFGAVKEVELNRIVAEHLGKELSQHKDVKVIYAHDANGYSGFLERYFKKQSKKIDSFVKKAKKSFAREVEKGAIEVAEAVPHGTATPVSAKRLYGINKWANENDIDLVLHIHFNDYGSRTEYGGIYTGFSVYVPHRELKSGAASIPIGQDIYDALSEISYPSNNPAEARHGGAIQDHELIALGASNTLKVPSVLIEYGYIYEPHVQSDFFRRAAEEFAYSTYIGLADFIGSPAQPPMKDHAWNYDIQEMMFGYPTLDVYLLQTALRIEGFFPEKGKTQFECPMNGIFDACTKSAIAAFQKKHGIKETGTLDAATRGALHKRLLARSR